MAILRVVLSVLVLSLVFSCDENEGPRSSEIIVIGASFDPNDGAVTHIERANLTSGESEVLFTGMRTIRDAFILRNDLILQQSLTTFLKFDLGSNSITEKVRLEFPGSQFIEPFNNQLVSIGRLADFEEPVVFVKYYDLDFNATDSVAIGRFSNVVAAKAHNNLLFLSLEGVNRVSYTTMVFDLVSQQIVLTRIEEGLSINEFNVTNTEVYGFSLFGYIKSDLNNLGFEDFQDTNNPRPRSDGLGVKTSIGSSDNIFFFINASQPSAFLYLLGEYSITQDETNVFYEPDGNLDVFVDSPMLIDNRNNRLVTGSRENLFVFDTDGTMERLIPIMSQDVAFLIHR